MLKDLLYAIVAAPLAKNIPIHKLFHIPFIVLLSHVVHLVNPSLELCPYRLDRVSCVTFNVLELILMDKNTVLISCCRKPIVICPSVWNYQHLLSGSTLSCISLIKVDSSCFSTNVKKHFCSLGWDIPKHQRCLVYFPLWYFWVFPNMESSIWTMSSMLSHFSFEN